MDRVYRGLGAEEVVRSRKAHGTNEITKHRTVGFWSHFRRELCDPIIRILILALAINLTLSIIHGTGLAESAGILFSILAATLVSTASGYKAEKTLEALGGDAGAAAVRVVREGRACEIRCDELVVGDIVLLCAGDAVPADGELVEGRLALDQSALNGESKEKTKTPGKARPDPNDPHSLLRGTLVSSGIGKMRVSAVGDSTLYGRLAGELAGTQSEKSPLKERLSRLAGQISRLGYAAAALVGVADLVNAFFISGRIAEMSGTQIIYELLHALTLAVTVIVVAVPEGLPMMISVVLSSNMHRMARDKVMVRRPVGIETAGNIDLLFCDKTGTLTRGRLRVEGIYLPDGERITSPSQLPESHRRLFELSCTLNNGAVWAGSSPKGGNATDRALLSFVGRRLGYEPPAVTARQPFDSVKKYSSATLGGRESLTLIKGAPELILPKCQLMLTKKGVRQADRHALTRIHSELCERAIRVIALAYRKGDEQIFLCFAGLADTPRRETAGAVATLRRAGIGVVMLTGDAPQTALAVARQCGITTKGGEGVMTSGELAQMSDDELRDLLPSLRVLARALPADKSRLVRIAGECGYTCAMTGDGTNDAPALKLAPVGFAMGSGSEVARQAGDIVILDDNISSITRAVLYGRTVFHSIRKFIIFQLTMNLCAVGVSLAAPFLGIETPVSVTQMLWINMIMDTLAGLAFAGEPPRGLYMKQAPRPRGEGVLCPAMISQILSAGLWTVAASLFFLTSPAVAARYSSHKALMCGFFCFFVFAGVFNSFNARTESLNLFSRLAANKAFMLIMAAVAAIQILLIFVGGELFGCTPLCPAEISFALLLAATVVPIDLLRKCLQRLAGK